MAINPQTGAVWLHEHGPRGGDEVNIPQAGRNYGWPVITYGIDYSGEQIGIGSAATGMDPQLLHWTPSIAPSVMPFSTGATFPARPGQPFVVSLQLGSLHPFVLYATHAVGPH